MKKLMNSRGERRLVPLRFTDFQTKLLMLAIPCNIPKMWVNAPDGLDWLLTEGYHYAHVSFAGTSKAYLFVNVNSASKTDDLFYFRPSTVRKLVAMAIDRAKLLGYKIADYSNLSTVSLVDELCKLYPAPGDNILHLLKK